MLIVKKRFNFDADYNCIMYIVAAPSNMLSFAYFKANLHIILVVFKLLEQAMKVVERIFEHRFWQQIAIDDMQFEFMKGEKPLTPFLL